MPGSLRVTQVKSTISHIERNRATIRALGLKHIGDTVVVPDNPATRGMVRQVRFLVTVEEIAEPARPRTRRAAEGSPAAGAAAPAGQRSEDGEEKA
jgi:large subunit ribosomal protein L30